ncbi:hypothetical protein L1887_58444 [Cichorium endivia]|nr:hypothetical protein L1887_58444 [Cichorium endivia]
MCRWSGLEQGGVAASRPSQERVEKKSSRKAWDRDARKSRITTALPSPLFSSLPTGARASSFFTINPHSRAHDEHVYNSDYGQHAASRFALGTRLFVVARTLDGCQVGAHIAPPAPGGHRTDAAQPIPGKHYRTTLASDLLYMTYDAAVNLDAETYASSSADAQDRQRAWDAESPYSVNHPAARKGDPDVLLEGRDCQQARAGAAHRPDARHHGTVGRGQSVRSVARRCSIASIRLGRLARSHRDHPRQIGRGELQASSGHARGCQGDPARPRGARVPRGALDVRAAEAEELCGLPAATCIAATCIAGGYERRGEPGHASRGHPAVPADRNQPGPVPQPPAGLPDRLHHKPARPKGVRKGKGSALRYGHPLRSQR